MIKFSDFFRSLLKDEPTITEKEAQKRYKDVPR